MKNREYKWYVHCSSGQIVDSLGEKELGERGLLPGLLTGWVGLKLEVGISQGTGTQNLLVAVMAFLEGDSLHRTLSEIPKLIDKMSHINTPEKKVVL